MIILQSFVSFIFLSPLHGTVLFPSLLLLFVSVLSYHPPPSLPCIPFLWFIFHLLLSLLYTPSHFLSSFVAQLFSHSLRSLSVIPFSSLSLSLSPFYTNTRSLSLPLWFNFSVIFSLLSLCLSSVPCFSHSSVYFPFPNFPFSLFLPVFFFCIMQLFRLLTPSFLLFLFFLTSCLILLSFFLFPIQ